jgi:hypothetical protein
VDADDAFARWVAESEPDLPLIANVLLWISELEFTGPPAVVGFSGDGIALAQGPAGLLIEFTVIPKPLFGLST